MAPWLAPALALVCLRSSKKSPHARIAECIDAIVGYRTGSTGVVQTDLEDGARLEIYSHYLGLSAQILVGILSMLLVLLMLFIYDNYNNKCLGLFCVTVLIVQFAIMLWALIAQPDKFAPWKVYLEGTSKKWYHGKYGLPPMKAALNRLRLVLLILGLVSSFVLCFASSVGRTDKPPILQRTATTVLQDTSITTPQSIAPTTPP
jgi:hypothetical protein